MNREATRIQSNTVNVSMRRNRKLQGQLELLRMFMIFLGSLAVLLGLLLMILPSFRVKNIVVEGNQYLTNTL